MVSYAAGWMRRWGGFVLGTLLLCNTVIGGCDRTEGRTDTDGLAGAESVAGGSGGGSSTGGTGVHSGGGDFGGAGNLGGSGPAVGEPCEDEGHKVPATHDCSEVEWAHLACTEGRWSAACEEAFVSEWSTLKDHLTNTLSITERWVALPLVEGGSYDFWVDWGDGASGHVLDWDDPDARHEYDAHGRYRILISGRFEGWMFRSLASCDSLYEIASYYDSVPDDHYYWTEYTDHEALKLEKILHWGPLALGATERQFAGAVHLDITAEDAPNLAASVSLRGAFCGCESLHADLNQWDTSHIADFSEAFKATAQSNPAIDAWDTSSATSMSEMFLDATRFNGDISGWDTSLVLDMARMFRDAEAFDQDIGSWDVSNVQTMTGMFEDAETFNQDLSSWDTSAVTDMSHMFECAYDPIAYDDRAILLDGYFYGPSPGCAFNQPIGAWDTSGVQDFSFMFMASESFNQDLSAWDTSSATSFDGMFAFAESFNQDVSGWLTTDVNSFHGQFVGATSFDQDLSAWDVTGASVADALEAMLQGTALSASNYDALLIGWATQDVPGDMTFGAGTTHYGSAAASARELLVNEKHWTITDGGLAP